MQQSIYYIKFALQFADMQITELVNIFNHQVGNRGWTNMRVYHDRHSLTSSNAGVSMSQSPITVKSSPLHIPLGTILPTTA